MDENRSSLSAVNGNENWKFTVCQDAFCIFALVVAYIIEALILVLNSVCLVVLRRVRGVQETTKLFMMSLTLSDLCNGIFFGIPNVRYYMFYPSVDGPFCKIMPFLTIALFTINVLSLVILTIDRFLAITYTLHYPRLMTLKRSKVMILLVWSLTIMLYSALYCISHVGNQRDQNEFLESVLLCAGRQPVLRYIIAAVLGVSLGTILILYAYILKVARRQARLIASQNILGNIEGRQNVPGPISTKSATTVIIITGTACLCWMPTFIVLSIDFIKDQTMPTNVYLIVIFLFGCSSWLNCIIYYWRNREFKQALHNLKLSCCH
ncbi:histamine H2 receptor-like [Asterias amurensis]|uniref:histamine H2 receptor-like n=1 Tax=Asterias amurensis TaxID=7602 RepID=UPI003AB53E48